MNWALKWQAWSQKYWLRDPKTGCLLPISVKNWWPIHVCNNRCMMAEFLSIQANISWIVWEIWSMLTYTWEVRLTLRTGGFRDFMVRMSWLVRQSRLSHHSLLSYISVVQENELWITNLMYMYDILVIWLG